MKRLLFSLLLLLTGLTSIAAQYTISGQVNLSPEWQPKVYLAAVNKLSDYYRTSPDMIVNTAIVEADGKFTMIGDNLPEEARFYRLYLMKTQNTDYDACLYVGGDDHNFAHLVLRNGESIHLVTDSSTVAPFGNYTLVGTNDNELMRTLARIVYPSFYFYRIKFPTELKFSEDKLHTDLKQFADTCRNTLVALAAVNNTDFDEYFDQDIVFYQSFGERLKKELPQSIYTKNYLLKIKYYANEDSVQSPWLSWLTGVFAILAISGWWNYFQANKRLKQQQTIRSVTHDQQLESLRSDLTQKEAEILQFIGQGKSNKEIAQALFIEISTVKTHINKLYAKAGVNNRQEARTVAQKLFT